ncbi:sigma-70 family RNA polymerase sigma factor [Mesobacillus subterraneus]|uniref:Sigma-70 family RNA polymerase sigma factor n=1 Tax=Mesobacillus subterraneus TaxID=285983 RepID=A0A3R9E643_9BACI|nr:sigma-70 family RNA polymerase sigma factor [Mesobacillus subterraneus]RSD27008.1 sigma-70 family RNA polymerase sigma factor [Mesobacillus subterraneus]
MNNFDQLAKLYEPMIHKIIRTLHIYKNQKEYFHTGLVALWEAAEGFNPVKGEFSSYAYSYIKGQILNEMSRNNKREERSFSPKEEYWESLVEENPDSPLEIEFLLSYCETLTEKETKWVIYTCVDFLSIKEIAEREHVSMSAVKQWRKGAKKKLRKEFLEVMD